MSLEFFAVRFGDGLVRFGAVESVTSTYFAPLFEDTVGAVLFFNAHYREKSLPAPALPDVAGELVEVMDYSGHYVRARATHDFLLTMHDWDSREDYISGEGKTHSPTQDPETWARGILLDDLPTY